MGNSRSAAIPMGRDRLAVKPSAKPTLVRTQHLPPAKPQLRSSTRTIRDAESARSGPPRVRPGPPWSSPANRALSCSDTGRTGRAGSAALGCCGAERPFEGRNTISRDHHSATWRLPIRRLGAVAAPAAGWPGTPAWTAAERTYPDPGPLTVTVVDTGWLANGRITSMSARITRRAHCWKCAYWPILCPARRQSRQPPWPAVSAGMTHPRAAANGQGGCVLAVIFPRTVGVAGSET